VKVKTKPITIEEYNKKMDKILKRCKGDVAKTLVKLLNEASKYHIVDANKTIPNRANARKGKNV
jgi:hypothetical protein